MHFLLWEQTFIKIKIFKAMKLLHNLMGIDQLSFHHRLWFALG